MEEKLYFAPADYGKGAHKRKEKQKKEKEGKNHRAIKLGGFLLFLTIIIVMIIWLLHGKTTTSGQYPENVRNEALTCISDGITYPIIPSLVTEEKELKINAIFKDTDKLKSISLVYTTNYSNEEDAYGAEAKSHALLNESLGMRGYNVGKFSNKFARYGNKLILSLYATVSEIDEYSADYLMLDKEPGIAERTLVEFKQIYEKQGFACEATTEQ